jgi:hypothetical protein
MQENTEQFNWYWLSCTLLITRFTSISTFIVYELNSNHFASSPLQSIQLFWVTARQDGSLSLLPAVQRIIDIFPALKSYVFPLH